MTNLFATASNTEVPMGLNQLEKSASLTNQAALLASTLLQAVTDSDADNKDEIEQMVKDSMASHPAMDALISRLLSLETEDVEYLKDESADTIDKMIKSQQSKRSRTKGKLMTMDNYRTMLTGAIAENLLRIASGKEKSSGASFVSSTTVYTEADLEKFANNTEELKKAIRNVQSKKSIAKSKADYDVSGAKWQQLLIAEAQLKAMRDNTAPISNHAAEINDKIASIVDDVDINALKASDAKQLLASIVDLLKSNETN